MRVRDLSGQSFGRLTVLSRHGSFKEKRGVRATWLCKCECGTERVFRANQLTAKNKSAKSCGCLHREKAKANAIEMGLGKKRHGSDENAIYYALFRENRNVAKRKGLEFDLPYDLFLSIITSACFYCGADPKPKRRLGTYRKITVLAHGIDRINSEKGYVIGNVAPCCITCNRMKSDKMAKDWFNHIERLSNNLNKLRRALCVEEA